MIDLPGFQRAFSSEIGKFSWCIAQPHRDHPHDIPQVVVCKTTNQGQREQSEIGLYYYGARWYDSSLGRFTSPDTIVPGAGNPLAWDRFSYVQNNPVRYTDPSGQWYYDPGCDCLVDNKDPNRQDDSANLNYVHNSNPIDLENSESFIPQKSNVANGVRAEFTTSSLIGFDLNLDYLYFNETNERNLFTTFSFLQIQTPQSFSTRQTGVSTIGFIHAENVLSPDSYEGIGSVGFGLDITLGSLPITVEIERAYGSPNPDKSIPSITYIGLGIGRDLRFYISPLTFTANWRDISDFLFGDTP